MQAGSQVRLIDNPSRLGTLTNQRSGTPPRERILVNFNDGKRELHLISALELTDGDGQIEDANDLILKGRYGRAKDLRGAITHHRLSGKIANLIYSLNTTNTEFFPYQFKPVLHFLESPSNGLLIADEVGLGKTIEAGLIWTELRAREDANRLLVVCPAVLKSKWIDELYKRFGVQAQDVDAENLLHHLEDIKNNPSKSFALVASIQGLRSPKGWDDPVEPSKSSAAKLSRFLNDMKVEQPIIDLVIIDEAHYLRNEATQTNKFAKLLREATQNLVLLSATPIQTNSKDLFNLLNLLDEDAFPYLSSYEWNIQANAPLVALRDQILRSTTVTPENFLAVMDYAKTRFHQSEQIKYLHENPPTQEQLIEPHSRAELADILDRINPLAKVVSRTLKRDVHELRVERDVKLLLVPLTPVEKIFYAKVSDAVSDVCEISNISSGFLLTYPQRQMVSSMAAACRGWKQKLQSSIKNAQVYDFDEGVEELGLEEAIEELSDQLPEKKELSDLMKALIRISYEVGDEKQLAKYDSKFKVLLKNLQEYWKIYPDKKVILFSFYRGTLDYLKERLTANGIDSVVVHGGMDKNAIINNFKNSSGTKILISSEVAAEGVDLQFSSLLINYDLPWNPAKIEQRIGRIDRIGQKEEKILIWNLILDETIDSRVYELLLERLNIFQRALGSMEIVVGDVIKRLTSELLSHKLSPKQQKERIEKAAIVIAKNNIEQKKLEDEATQLIAHGDFIQNKVKAAANLGRYLIGSDLFIYVNDYLREKFPGTDFLAQDADETKVSVNLSVDCRIELQLFLERRRLQGQTRILAFPPPILWFENRHGESSSKFEKITQDHPLIRFVSEHQRATSTISIYQPAVSVTISNNSVDKIESGIYVFTVMRWMFSGSRDTERLQYRVAHLNSEKIIDGDEAEKFVNTAAMHGIDWLGAATLPDPVAIAAIQDTCRAELEDQFFEYRDSYKREDSDRIRLMIQMLEHQLEQKRQKTYEDIERLRLENNQKKIRLIPMREGTLKKLSNKIDTRIAELRSKEKLVAEQELVSSGVIRVT